MATTGARRFSSLTKSDKRTRAKLQAQLYYARKRRVTRKEAQQAQKDAGNPGIFSADFSGDFE